MTIRAGCHSAGASRILWDASPTRSSVRALNPVPSRRLATSATSDLFFRRMFSCSEHRSSAADALHLAGVAIMASAPSVHGLATRMPSAGLEEGVSIADGWRAVCDRFDRTGHVTL